MSRHILRGMGYRWMDGYMIRICNAIDIHFGLSGYIGEVVLAAHSSIG